MSNVNLVLLCDSNEIRDSIVEDLVEWWGYLSTESYDDYLEIFNNLESGDHFYLDRHDTIFLGFRGENPKFQVITH